MQTELKRIRTRNNLTQRQIAKMLNISQSYYEKIEQGRREVSTAFILQFKIAFPYEDINKVFFNR